MSNFVVVCLMFSWIAGIEDSQKTDVHYRYGESRNLALEHSFIWQLLIYAFSHVNGLLQFKKKYMKRSLVWAGSMLMYEEHVLLF